MVTGPVGFGCLVVVMEILICIVVGQPSDVVVVTFSSLAMILGECSTIYSPSVL